MEEQSFSSESSESKSEKKCRKEVCVEDLCIRYASAVVRVNGEFSLTTSAFVAPPAPLPAYNSYFTQGNGFFIDHKDRKKKERRRFLICPASLVLIAPNVMGQNNRFPFVSNSDIVPPVGVVKVPNKMTKVSRIMVEVFNVNGKGKSYVYEAELVGVDGAGNSAVLKICHKTPWNEENPKIKDCHAALEWGCAAKVCCGQTVWGLGNSFSEPRTAPNQYGNTPSGPVVPFEGKMLSNHHIDNAGWAQQQLILTSILTYGNNVGMPILDKYGRVIGMQVSNQGSASNLTPDVTYKLVTDGAAISQVFIKRALKCFYRGEVSSYGIHIGLIADNLGSYYRYKKGYLGLAWQIMYGVDYSAPSNVNLMRTIQYDPNTFLPVSGPDCKRIIGLEIIGVAGATASTTTQVPGAAPFIVGTQVYDLLENSPLLGILTIGDIITKVGKYELGELDCEYSGSLVTWKHSEGDSICIEYKLASEGYSIEHNLKLKLLDYPFLMDYPWSMIYAFPLVNLPAAIYSTNPRFPTPTTLFRTAF